MFAFLQPKAAFAANPPGSLQFGASTYSFAESAGVIQIPVTRVGGDQNASSVTYTIAAGTGTATQGVDYTATYTGTLSWGNKDQATKYINITVVDDAGGEANETINITLSGASNSTQGSPEFNRSHNPG